MARKRIARLNEQLKRELTTLLQFEVKDPRITTVSILDVEVSPDLYHAKVFYTLRGDEEERRLVHEGLRAAAGYLRTELGRRMHIRRAPELHFAFDNTLEHAMHIERLLQEARATMATEPDAEEPGQVDADGTEHDEA
ncbi:30S ribosome-binding factor RbfA [soil metagenome]